MFYDFESGRNWCLALILLTCSMSTRVKAEEPVPLVDATKDRNLPYVVDKTLRVLSKIKLAGQKYIAHDKVMRFEIDEAKTLLELRLQYSRALLLQIDKNLESKNQTLIQLAAERQSFDSEVKSIGRETLDELSRICLLERQRLEWDAATAELRIEAAKNGQATSRDVERARLQSRKLEIEGIQQQLLVARAEYEQMKSLFEKGTISSTEARKAEGSFRGLENRLQIAMVDLEANEVEANLNGESSLEKPVIEKKSIDVRTKLIEGQLEKLTEQRKFLNHIAAIDRQIELTSRAIHELALQVQQIESERMSYEVLEKMLVSALEKPEHSAEQRKDEADK